MLTAWLHNMLAWYTVSLQNSGCTTTLVFPNVEASVGVALGLILVLAYSAEASCWAFTNISVEIWNSLEWRACSCSMIASKLCPKTIDWDMKSVTASSCAAIFTDSPFHRFICERHALSSFSAVRATYRLWLPQLNYKLTSGSPLLQSSFLRTVSRNRAGEWHADTNDWVYMEFHNNYISYCHMADNFCGMLHFMFDLTIMKVPPTKFNPSISNRWKLLGWRTLSKHCVSKTNWPQS